MAVADRCNRVWWFYQPWSQLVWRGFLRQAWVMQVTIVWLRYYVSLGYYA